MSAASSTAPHAVPAASRPAARRRGPTFPGVVAAEWTKLTSLRSTSVIAAVTVVVTGVLTYLSANASSVDPGFDPLGSLTAGLVLAQVGPLVLGVLVGTGEFSTGTFRTTFAAVPRRLPVLAAQAVVTAASALVISLVAVGAAVFGILPAAASRGIDVDLTVNGTPQVLAGMTVLLVGMALLGQAVGALLRRAVPAVLTAVALVLVLPVALLLASEVASGPPMPGVPGETVEVSSQEAAVNTAVTLLPGGAGQLLVAPGGAGVEGAPDLGPWGGGLVLAAWVLVPLGAAAVRLRLRDVT